jgi:hypothetical protein
MQHFHSCKTIESLKSYVSNGEAKLDFVNGYFLPVYRGEILNQLFLFGNKSWVCSSRNVNSSFRISVCSGVGRSHRPQGLRRESAAFRLLEFQVRIRPGARMSIYYKCCLLSGRGVCDELIIRPEESYRVWCVWVWSRNLKNEEA